MDVETNGRVQSINISVDDVVSWDKYKAGERM